MATRLCASCTYPFVPRPQSPNQTYCSSPACQRARRSQWMRMKVAEDPDYREYRQHANRAWHSRHPDYWRTYRKNHPEYAERNRNRQRADPHAIDASDLAKTYASTPLAGIYRIAPIAAPGPAKSDTWIVEITRVCADCPCKVDACKDST